MCVPSRGYSIPMAIGSRGILRSKAKADHLVQAPMMVLSLLFLWVHAPLFKNKVTMDVVYTVVVFWVLVGLGS